MAHHHHESDSKNFVLPAFLSFALVFCLLMAFSQCSGPYHPQSAHGGAAEHHEAPKTETHGEHH
jgi:hypothetical protein